MSDETSERAYRPIDQIIAIARLIELENLHNENEVSDCIADYVDQLTKCIQLSDCKFKSCDALMVVLWELMQTLPIKKIPERVAECQN